MSELPGIMPLQDKRVKDIKYIEVMYETVDGDNLLFHYTPKSAGVEENILSVSDDGSGYKRLDLKFHFVNYPDLKRSELEKALVD